MKKIISLILACWVCGAVWAQSASQYLELANHPELINPSYEGGEKGLSALFLYGEKWSGFKGAPKTTGFNARYGFKNLVGIGIKGDFEKTGHRNNNIVGANVDVNIRLSEYSDLAFGLYMGLEMWHYTLGDAVIGEPGMIMENYDRNNFIGGFGITYRWKKLAVGASSYVSFYKEDANMTSSYLTASYDFTLTADWHMRPVAMYSYNNRFDDFWEAGVMAGFQRFVKVGVTYRDRQGVNVMAGVTVLKMLRLGACYGINTGELADLSKKSFEISVGFKMNKD